MLVDAHAHITTSDTTRYPAGPVGGHDLAPGALVDPFDAEQLACALHESGIPRAVVVQRTHVYGFDNGYLLDSAEAHPDLFVPVVSISATAPDAVDRLEHCVERGAKGVRFSFPGEPAAAGGEDTGWFASDEALPVWKRAGELGLPVCVHFFRANREAGLMALARLAHRFGDLPIIVDHLGNCEVELGPPDYGMSALVDVNRPNVTFKLVPINFKFLHRAHLAAAPFVRRAVDLFGAERLMYGSDITNSPGTHAELMAEGRDALSELTPSECGEILGSTATRVYGLA